MIVKMTILRHLGSSDDKEKEKIGIARPEGLPLRGFRGSQGSALKALRLGAPEEPTPGAPVHPTLVGRTNAMMFGAEWNRSQVSL